MPNIQGRLGINSTSAVVNTYKTVKIVIPNIRLLYLTQTKHVEIDRHFIKEKLDNGLIATEYIPSRLQLADMFTKGLRTKQFKDLTCKLGMIDIHSPA